MKKVMMAFLVIALMVSVMSFAAEAISFTNPQNIPYSEKIPLETPHFKPVLDAVKDEGYTTTYEIKETTARFHEGTTLSTAWYGNTLYFYLFVPDTSPQEEPGSPPDGPWFLLYFGGDSDTNSKWTENAQAKTFKILPGFEGIIYEGASSETGPYSPQHEDFMFALDYTEEGYTLELAYIVPKTLSDLHGTQEIAFEIEVSDVNDGYNYRYFVANENRDAVVNFCTAWGAKLVLEASPDEDKDESTSVDTEPSTSDSASASSSESVSETESASDTTEDKKDSASPLVPVVAVVAVVIVAVIVVAIIKKRR